ncbi:alpha-D-ribose 1-methylphosphonate 5-triphosphate diphosphatase [Rhodovulum sp. DZ06]|uniref:alpha-D-ribose 1-methylphosphonate 5-triphosphate diphosphatase n=1 Tax=Rhodovulum sp. DZ06 TaxID=3425126 RepID=UPI003D33E536
MTVHQKAAAAGGPVSAEAIAGGDAVFANASVVLAGEVIAGSVRVENGRIVEVAPGPCAVPGALDMGGDLLAPGLVELHTDNLERHLQPRPGVHWPLPAAVIAHDAELASVGITTVFDALRVGSVESFTRANYSKYARGLADEIIGLKRAGALKISHFLHLRAEICSETLLAEMDEFGPEDDVRIVSLMDHTPGQRQFRDLSKLRQYHEGKYGSGGGFDFDEYVAFLVELKSRMGESHEDGAVERARGYGAVIASHDDTDPAHVAVSARQGCKVAEFPTTLEAARACREAGIAVMMGAPNLLRGGSHSGNVAAQDLLDEGLLDIFSSDYAPASLLMAAVRMGREGGDMAAGLRTVTAAPAQATGLADRGEIAPGLRADLVRINTAHAAPAVRGVWIAGTRQG